MLALAFLILVGFALIAEDWALHIPKGYLYFAMAFSVCVEMINLRLRKLLDAPARNHHAGGGVVYSPMPTSLAERTSSHREHPTSWNTAPASGWQLAVAPADRMRRKSADGDGRGRRHHQDRRVRLAHRQGSDLRPVLAQGHPARHRGDQRRRRRARQEARTHHEDNRSKPGESATIAKKLITRDKVVAILGEVASSRSLEAAPIAQAARSR